MVGDWAVACVGVLFQDDVFTSSSCNFPPSASRPGGGKGEQVLELNCKTVRVNIVEGRLVTRRRGVTCYSRSYVHFALLLPASPQRQGLGRRGNRCGSQSTER